MSNLKANSKNMKQNENGTAAKSDLKPLLPTREVYNECCTDTMAKMPDGFIDLIVTSPPYNMRTRIRNGEYTTREKSEHFSKKYKHFHDALPVPEFYEFHSKAITEMMRVAKVVCYNIQIVTGSKEAFLQIIGDNAKYIKDIMIWDKGNGQPAMHEKVLNRCYEMIIVLERDEKAGRVIQNANFPRGEMDDILRIGRGKKEVDVHSAVFPLKLPRLLIRAFSKPNDLVYDPFMGTGSTAIACIKEGREWIGSELTDEYCEIAKNRIKPYLQQGALFRVGG